MAAASKYFVSVLDTPKSERSYCSEFTTPDQFEEATTRQSRHFLKKPRMNAGRDEDDLAVKINFTVKSVESANPCAICLESVVKSRARLDSCSHSFCFDCILEWSKVSVTCPLCKKKFCELHSGSPMGRGRMVSCPVSPLNESSDEESNLSDFIVDSEEEMDYESSSESEQSDVRFSPVLPSRQRRRRMIVSPADSVNS